MAATIISTITRLAAGLICGYIMGAIVSNDREFPDRYVVYLSIIVAVGFVLLTGPKSLSVLELALVVYTAFVAINNIKPLAAFFCPTILMIGTGIYWCRITNVGWLEKLTLFAVSALAIAWPLISREKAKTDNEKRSQDIVISRSKFYRYLAIAIVATIAVIIIAIKI